MPNYPVIGDAVSYVVHGNAFSNVFYEAKLTYDDEGLFQGWVDRPSIFFGYGGSDTFFADSGTPSHGFADIDKHEDVFNGGGGIDHVSYHQSADGVVVDMDYFGLGGGMAHRQGQSAYVDNPYFGYERDKLISIENVTGSDHNDIISGDAYANVLMGRAGNDFILGGSNHDTVYGGIGDDTIKGDDHNDELFGGHGNDSMEGGTGHDTLHGGDDNDTLKGGSGNDELHGEDGNDRIYGHGDDDKGYGGLGDDTLYMGSGDDTAYGGEGDDFILMGSGENWAFGGLGFNTIYGGADDDVVSLGEQGIAKTYNGDDYIVGGLMGDTIEAGNGDDTLIGGGGNDLLKPGNGDDDVFGGAGTDTVSYEDVSANVFVSLVADFTTGSGISHSLDSVENVIGSSYGDAIIADNSANTLLGKNGDDLLDGNGGLDVIYGGNGDDTLNGGSQTDFLFGEDDNDELFGEGGNDFLFGGDGNDFLDGGSGADQMTGGIGADTFVFNDIYGAVDTVTDFVIGTDRLDIDGVLATPPEDGGSYVGQVLAFSENGGADTQLWAKSGFSFRKVAVLEGIDHLDVADAVSSGELFDINPIVVFEGGGGFNLA